MKGIIFCLLCGIMSACSKGSSGSSSSSGPTIVGTWDTGCVAVTIPSGDALAATYYGKRVLTFSASGSFDDQNSGYSDAACATAISDGADTGKYTLGGEAEDVAGAYDLDLVGAETVYDIVKFTDTTLTLGKMDATHDGSSASSRPAELETAFTFTKEGSDGGGSGSEDADCGLGSPATISYTMTDSTYVGTAPSEMVCGVYTEIMAGATDIHFDVEVSKRSTVQGAHSPLDFGFAGYPAEAGKSYDCDITFANDDLVSVLVSETCTLTVTSVSGSSISGTFSATNLTPLFGTASASGVTGTFSIE